MVVPTFNISAREIVYIVSGFFVLAVLIHSYSQPNDFATNTVLIPFVYFDDLNNIFFNGNDIFSSKVCGSVLDGFFNPLIKSQTIPDKPKDFFQQAADFLATILTTLANFIYGLFVFLEKIITSCGFAGVRFLVGIGLLASHLYFLASFITAINHATSSFR